MFKEKCELSTEFILHFLYSISLCFLSVCLQTINQLVCLFFHVEMSEILWFLASQNEYLLGILVYYDQAKQNMGFWELF